MIPKTEEIQKTQKKPTICNKQLIQSFILTAAKYDFSVYEKRILYYLVTLAQGEVEGLKFPKDCIKVKHDLWKNAIITMPIRFALANDEDKNHKLVKDALISLTQKGFEYEDDKKWMYINLVTFPELDKRDGTISFTVHEKIWDCIMDFSKGFTKFELAVALNLKSPYSMRFYELISNQKNPICYSLQRLREMLKLGDKYKLAGDLIRRVIEPARKELYEKAPYTFEFTANKVGKKIVSFTFFPIKQAEKRDDMLYQKELIKQYGLRWEIPDDKVRRYLTQSMGFTQDEVKRNLDTFKVFLQISKDPLYDLAILNAKSQDKDNPKGWIINSLKGRIKDFNKKYGFNL